MQRLRRLLGSERGDLLIDSMFGAVILGIMMAATGSILMGAIGASTGNHNTTVRSVLLNTVLADEKPRLSTYTATPRSVTRTVNGASISVSIWREEPSAGITLLKAATPKPTVKAQSADCAGPDRLDPAKCLTSSTVVTTSQGGVEIETVTLAPGTTGALADFTVPAGATELRYVFKVTAAPADSTLTFGNRDHPDVRHIVKLPAGQTGYFYGRILVTADSKLFLQSAGPAVIDAAGIMIYEAPTP